jgi:hypothetical protein
MPGGGDDPAAQALAIGPAPGAPSCTGPAFPHYLASSEPHAPCSEPPNSASGVAAGVAATGLSATGPPPAAIKPPCGRNGAANAR